MEKNNQIHLCFFVGIYPHKNRDEYIKTSVDESDDYKTEDHKEYTTLNLGPTHPATHGIFQNVLKMDGEIIVDSEPTIGYIHRAFEKLAEHKPFTR